MMLDARQIASLLPHRGAMCLIDSVLSADATTLRCRASSHRVTDHPLADAQRIGAPVLIEYAAQAMALHGAINAPAETGARQAAGMHGVVAGVRSVTLHVERIDNLLADLDIEVSLASGDSSTAIYSFRVSSDESCLAEGRATVLFAPQRIAP